VNLKDFRDAIAAHRRIALIDPDLALIGAEDAADLKGIYDRWPNLSDKAFERRASQDEGMLLYVFGVEVMVVNRKRFLLMVQRVKSS
jgi:hypothetical protein